MLIARIIKISLAFSIAQRSSPRHDEFSNTTSHCKKAALLPLLKCAKPDKLIYSTFWSACGEFQLQHFLLLKSKPLSLLHRWEQQQQQHKQSKGRTDRWEAETRRRLIKEESAASVVGGKNLREIISARAFVDRKRVRLHLCESIVAFFPRVEWQRLIGCMMPD